MSRFMTRFGCIQCICFGSFIGQYEEDRYPVYSVVLLTLVKATARGYFPSYITRNRVVGTRISTEWRLRVETRWRHSLLRSMASGLLSPLLSSASKLLDLLRSRPSGSCPPPSGRSTVSGDVERLERLLRRIQGTLDDVGEREVRDSSVKLWIEELTDLPVTRRTSSTTFATNYSGAKSKNARKPPRRPRLQ
jgi:hypothetical protein